MSGILEDHAVKITFLILRKGSKNICPILRIAGMRVWQINLAPRIEFFKLVPLHIDAACGEH
jgi:hypothetical protein